MATLFAGEALWLASSGFESALAKIRAYLGMVTCRSLIGLQFPYLAACLTECI